MKRIVVPIALLIAVGGLLAWWLLRRSAAAQGADLPASGTVEATEARLGFEVGGRIAEILAREGDEVALGQVLARLDSIEAEARRQQALARLETARAVLAELLAGPRREEIGEAAAVVEASRVRRDNARTERARAERLHAGGAISREVYDRTAAEEEVATADLAQSTERLRLLARGTRRERIAAQRSQVAEAEAAVVAADATLGKLTLEAPTAGRVTVRHREPGEIVAPGTAVVTVADLADRWVRIYVPEDSIGAVALGSRARITSDTYPAKEYPGEVVSIASEAEFTPKSVQTRQERVRLVYAVKVRIAEDEAYELKPGMPVDVVLPLSPSSPGGRGTG